MNITEESLIYELTKHGFKGESPKSVKYHTKHYEYILGVGEDHTASLIIEEDALSELKKLLGEDNE